MPRRVLLDVPSLRSTTVPTPASRANEAAPAAKPAEVAPVESPPPRDIQTFGQPATPVSLYTEPSKAGEKPARTRSASLGWDSGDRVAEQRAAQWKKELAKAGSTTTLSFGSGTDAVSVKLRSATHDGLTAAQLVDQIASTDGGRALLSAPDLPLERAQVAFVPNAQMPAFADAYLRATGEELPGNLTAAVLWVKGDDGSAVPLIAVPEGSAHNTFDVTADLRRELDFRDEDHAPKSRTSEVLARAKAATDGGDFDQMRASLRELLTADVSDKDVKAALSELQQRLAPLRAHTGQALMEVQSFSGMVKKQHAKVAELSEKGDSPALRTERAELQRLYDVDDRLLNSTIEAAERRTRLRGLIAETPEPSPGERRPEWFKELKGQLHGDVAALFQGFEKCSEKRPAEADGWPPKELSGAYERAMGKVNDPKQFEQWLGKFMDRVADRMAQSDNPIVQEHWRNKRFSPAVVDQVIEEMAREQGFGGVHTLEPGAGVVDHDAFGKIIEEKKLLLDPYFTVDRSLGPHGRVVHAMQWLYLSENDRQAVDLYQNLGEHTREARADINKGKEGYAWKAVNEFYSHRNWLFSPDNFTRFIADFTGAD